MMAEVSIGLPFSIDAYGRVFSTQSQEKLWADRVRSVIGTTVQERVMRKDFGTRIAYTVFDEEQTAESEVRTEIESAFTSQLPLLRLSSVSVSFDSYTNNTKAEVVYDLPNNQTVTTTVAIVYLDGNNSPYQENL